MHLLLATSMLLLSEQFMVPFDGDLVIDVPSVLPHRLGLVRFRPLVGGRS